MLTKQFLLAYLRDLAEKKGEEKLKRIKAGLAKRGWDVTVLVKAKPGASLASLVRDFVGAVVDAF